MRRLGGGTRVEFSKAPLISFLFFNYTYFLSVFFLRELSSSGSESREKTTFHVLIELIF